MITDEILNKNVSGMQRLQVNCDICNKPVAFFIKYIDSSFDYEVIKNERIKILCVSTGIFHFCGKDCMDKWISENSHILDHDAKTPIEEDKYAIDKEKDKYSFDSSEDVHPDDIIEPRI